MNTITGICHSMEVTVWYAGLDVRSNLHTRQSPTQGDIPGIVFIQLNLLMMST